MKIPNHPIHGKHSSVFRFMIGVLKVHSKFTWWLLHFHIVSEDTLITKNWKSYENCFDLQNLVSVSDNCVKFQFIRRKRWFFVLNRGDSSNPSCRRSPDSFLSKLLNVVIHLKCIRSTVLQMMNLATLDCSYDDILSPRSLNYLFTTNSSGHHFLSLPPPLSGRRLQSEDCGMKPLFNGSTVTALVPVVGAAHTLINMPPSQIEKDE